MAWAPYSFLNDILEWAVLTQTGGLWEHNPVWHCQIGTHSFSLMQAVSGCRANPPRHLSSYPDGSQYGEDLDVGVIKPPHVAPAWQWHPPAGLGTAGGVRLRVRSNAAPLGEKVS